MSQATTIESPLLERVQDLQNHIAEGRIVEAMHEFYAEDVSMQDNSMPPTVGLAQNIAREEAWLATVAEFKGFEVLSIAAEGDVTFVESTMDYVTQDGDAVHGEQVSRARWENGKIKSERFYHE